MTSPKHLLLLAAAAVSTVFAVSAQAQFWDEDDESVFRVGEEVFAAGNTLSLGGNSGLTWAAGNTVVSRSRQAVSSRRATRSKCLQAQTAPLSPPVLT